MTIASVSSNLFPLLESARQEGLAEFFPKFHGVAIVIGCIAAGITVIKTASDFLSNNEITFYALVRPLVLLACIFLFKPVVLAPLDTLTGIVSRDIAANTTSNVADLTAKLVVKRYQNSVSTTAKRIDSIKATKDDEGGAIGKFWNNRVVPFLRSMWATIIGSADLLRIYADEGLLAVASAIAWAIQLGLQIMAYLYLTLMGCFGPLIFALSIITRFSSGVKLWIERYVQFSLWIPIGMMVLNIGFKMGTAVLTTEGYLGGILSTFVVIMMCLMLLAVPKVCSWIIESAGDAGVANSISGAAKSVVGTVAKVI